MSLKEIADGRTTITMDDDRSQAFGAQLSCNYEKKKKKKKKKTGSVIFTDRVAHVPQKIRGQANEQEHLTRRTSDFTTSQNSYSIISMARTWMARLP